MNGAKSQLTVGVLGGLGPEATLDFFGKVIAATPVQRDQDHLHLLIDNNPKVPNRNEAVAGTGPSPAPQLAAMARRLEGAGADFLVMPCNAAHAFLPAITGATRLPVVSIIDETTRATLARVPHLETAGILASSGCLDAGLYHQSLAHRGIGVLEPQAEDRDAFMELLYRIKTGDKSADVRKRMQEIAHTLIERGAEVVIAGCTEVPLVLFEGDLPCPLINSTDVLVASTIRYATRAEALPETQPA
ncbi:MAG: amino acid racemase [Trueperaceae bacterium]|nr:MAG: amino acid racemase [Trueperaceae bacterium]